MMSLLEFQEGASLRRLNKERFVDSWKRWRMRSGYVNQVIDCVSSALLGGPQVFFNSVNDNFKDITPLFYSSRYKLRAYETRRRLRPSIIRLGNDNILLDHRTSRLLNSMGGVVFELTLP